MLPRPRTARRLAWRTSRGSVAHASSSRHHPPPGCDVVLRPPRARKARLRRHAIWLDLQFWEEGFFEAFEMARRRLVATGQLPGEKEWPHLPPRERNQCEASEQQMVFGLLGVLAWCALLRVCSARRRWGHGPGRSVLELTRRMGALWWARCQVPSGSTWWRWASPRRRHGPF